jgi:hypothetical protein
LDKREEVYKVGPGTGGRQAIEAVGVVYEAVLGAGGGLLCVEDIVDETEVLDL